MVVMTGFVLAMAALASSLQGEAKPEPEKASVTFHVSGFT
jgi:hypothetical protein